MVREEQAMTVKRILDVKGRDVVTATPATSVAELVKLLSERRIGAVVVTGADARVVGIVSERDVVRALGSRGAACLSEPVSAIMTRDVVTCVEQERIVDVMRKMTAGRFRHVPVVADHRLAGLISIGDVVKHRVGELESEAEQLRDYIHAG
jgi:CBS domain-containing protein